MNYSIRRKKRYFILAFLLAVLAVLSAETGYIRTEAADKNDPAAGETSGYTMLYEDKKEKVGTGQVYAEVSCRYANYIKYGRYMCLDVIIHNDSSSDFAGFIRTVLPDADGTMYQKAISVKKKKYKKTYFVFPAEFNEGHFYFSLVDTGDEEKASAELGLNISMYSERICIGVMSDEPRRLGYLDSGSTDVFSLDSGDIAEDRKAFELMDVIVINDSSIIEDLSEDQVNAVIQWVNNGGTLVIAAEKSSTDDPSLSIFNDKLYRIQSVYDSVLGVTSFGLQDNGIAAIKSDIKRDLKEKKIEAAEQFLKENLTPELYTKRISEIENIEDNTSILSRSGEVYNSLTGRFTKKQLDSSLSVTVSDEDEKRSEKVKVHMIPKEIHSLMISGGSTLLSENGENIVQYIDSELGRVIFFESDIGLENKYFDAEGTRIRKVITDNISSEGKSKLRASGSAGSAGTGYYYEDGLGKNDNANLPNLILYAMILALYIALNGPLIYLILRKRNKVMYVWITIPAVAVVFSLLIYFLGASTRIERPFSNYLAQLNIRSTGQAELTTYFSLSSPDNAPYKAVFKENRDITTLTPEVYSYSAVNTYNKASDYRYGVESSNGSTSILMNNVPAFKRKNFCDRTFIKGAKGVQCTVTADRNQFYGEVTNNMDTDLENCFIFDNGRAVRLGDIKRGEKINFSTSEDKDTLITQADYKYDISNIGAVLLGHDPDDSISDYTVTEQRMRDLINAYTGSPANSEGIYFYGFTSDIENPLLNELSIKTSGITGVSQNISVSYTYDGKTVLPDISSYKLKYDSDLTDGIKVFTDRDREVQVTYSLPDRYRYGTLIYSADNNSEFSTYGSEYNDVFEGTVSVRDTSSGKKKILFESGVEGNADDIGKYVTKDNKLTLIYDIEGSRDDRELRLPLLMLSTDIAG